ASRSWRRRWSSASWLVMRSDSASSLPLPEVAAACSIRSRRLFCTRAMRRSTSARAGDGALGGRAVFRRSVAFFRAGLRLLTAFCTAAFLAAAFFAAPFFAIGRLPAFLPLAFAPERRDADFFFAAMVPLLSQGQVYPPISLTAICYLGIGCRP